MDRTNQVNERAARLQAGVVAGTLVLGVALGQSWVMPLLALGFVLRAGWGPRLSPLARVAAATARRLWPVRPTPAAPKRFAQAMGAGMLTVASVLALAGSSTWAWVVAAIVALFATLEAVLAFCMGCLIYGRLIRRGAVAPDVCVDCARGPEAQA